MPALAAAAIAGLLALAAVAGQPVLAAGVLFVQGMLAVGGIRPLALPARRGVAALALLAAATATGVAAFGSDRADLGPIAPVLGLTFVPAVAIQLRRRDGRAMLVGSLSSSITVVTLAVLPSFWVTLAAAGGGRAGLPTVLLAMAGVAAAAVVEALPGSRAVVRTMGVVTAAAVGAGLSAWVPVIEAEVAALSALTLTTFAGLMAAAAWAIGDRVQSEVAARLVPMEALLWWRCAGPFAAGAPVGYVLGRVLVG